MIQDSQPTKQEIAEIVNKAISLTVYSYNGANKRLLKNPINKV